MPISHRLAWPLTAVQALGLLQTGITLISEQWRIQDFPRWGGGGHQLLSLGHKSNIWQDFCQELHEIERNCTERWCVSLAHPPSGSANAQEMPLPPPPNPRSLRFHETVMKTCLWIFLIQT